MLNSYSSPRHCCSQLKSIYLTAAQFHLLFVAINSASGTTEIGLNSYKSHLEDAIPNSCPYIYNCRPVLLHSVPWFCGPIPLNFGTLIGYDFNQIYPIRMLIKTFIYFLKVTVILIKFCKIQPFPEENTIFFLKNKLRAGN